MSYHVYKDQGEGENVPQKTPKGQQKPLFIDYIASKKNNHQTLW